MDDFCRNCRRVTPEGHEEIYWICTDCRVGEPNDQGNQTM